MPTEYPTDFKQKVIKRYQNGESIKSLSHELNISQGTLYRWRKEYCSIQGINRTYTPKEFDAISRRLAKLEHEMEVVRLSQCITSVPLQKRLSILENRKRTIITRAEQSYGRVRCRTAGCQGISFSSSSWVGDLPR